VFPYGNWIDFLESFATVEIEFAFTLLDENVARWLFLQLCRTLPSSC